MTQNRERKRCRIFVRGGGRFCGMEETEMAKEWKKRRWGWWEDFVIGTTSFCSSKEEVEGEEDEDEGEECVEQDAFHGLVDQGRYGICTS